MMGRSGFYMISLSVVCNATAYHAVKAALADGTPATVATVASLATFVMFLVMGWLWRAAGWSFGGFHRLRMAEVARWIVRRWRIASLAALFGGGANVLLQTCVSEFGPEIAAFLANMTLVFLVLGGLLMGERIRLREAAVIGVILLGATLFSYEGGQFHWAAIALMVFACLGTAAKQLTIRRAALSTALPVVMAGMQIGMGLASGLIGLATGTLAVPSGASIAWTCVAALIGSVCGMMLLYAGYGRIGVSRGAPVDAMRPLGVLLIGLALGAALPEPSQMLGAALVLGGSATLAKLHPGGRTRAAGRSPGAEPATPPSPTSPAPSQRVEPQDVRSA